MCVHICLRVHISESNAVFFLKGLLFGDIELDLNLNVEKNMIEIFKRLTKHFHWLIILIGSIKTVEIYEQTSVGSVYSLVNKVVYV